MKKIFTLLAVALAAVSVQAQGFWFPEETAPEAGTAIIDNDMLTVSTVFATTAGVLKDEDDQPTTVAYGDLTLSNYIQIRVNAAPTADTPTGTDNGGSTPLVVVVKKDVDLTIYYRRQSKDDAFVSNDGKDVLAVDQTAPAKALSATDFNYTPIGTDGAYAYADKTWRLTAGNTYTLYARGTTIQTYGFMFNGASGEIEKPELTDGSHLLSWEGFTAANKLEYDNGITLQITGNETKTISGGKAITINGKKYTSMKVSNGAQNTMTLPDGKTTSKVIFYSYVNKDAATERDSYWKEVAGVTYETPEEAGGIFEAFTDGLETPDVRTYTFDATSTVTFTNTGEQCCYVMEVIVGEPGEDAGISAPMTTITLGQRYNLAGQKVSASYKGVVLQDGKKYVVK